MRGRRCVTLCDTNDDCCMSMTVVTSMWFCGFAAATETKKEEKVEEKEEFDYVSHNGLMECWLFATFDLSSIPPAPRYLYPKHEAEYKAGKASGKSERITITSEKGKVKSSLKKDNNVKEKIGACTVTP
ncbi:hypothetical protein Tco_0533882 [Tanacetum coccineum]